MRYIDMLKKKKKSEGKKKEEKKEREKKRNKFNSLGVFLLILYKKKKKLSKYITQEKKKSYCHKAFFPFCPPFSFLPSFWFQFQMFLMKGTPSSRIKEYLSQSNIHLFIVLPWYCIHNTTSALQSIHWSVPCFILLHRSTQNWYHISIFSNIFHYKPLIYIYIQLSNWFRRTWFI